MRISSRGLVQVLPLLIATIFAEACTSPNGVICTEEFRYGLNVSVVDSLTSSAPASAILIAHSGTYVDSVGPEVPFQLNGVPVLLLSTAGERAGTYDLNIRSPGYRDWTRSGIKVTADACHVNPIAITARLQR
jgi:hypothetical protein